MMFENINVALEYIESKRKKRSIDEFRKTLRECGINVKQKNMIHIAGTNGKGSTVNYLRSTDAQYASAPVSTASNSTTSII